jgi:hypothetical protein
LRRLFLKTILLPRQARDKHRENSKMSGVFRRLDRSEPVPAPAKISSVKNG